MQALQIHREQLSEIKQWLQGCSNTRCFMSLLMMKGVYRFNQKSTSQSSMDWLKLKVQINNKAIPREKVKKTFNLLQQHKVVLKS